MVSPGIDINVFDASVFAPATSNAIVGVVGPATRGPVNRLEDFADEGAFVERYGRPLIERMHAVRAGNRYLKSGNQLKFSRAAGSLLATAAASLLDATGLVPVLGIVAADAGTWANPDGDNIQVAIVHNPGAGGPTSYNVYVYRRNNQVETYLNQDNGIVETSINGGSSLIRVTLANGAGTTFPAETTNVVTGELDRVNLDGGDDGAFASTRSPDSSTGPLAGKRFHGTQNPVAGSRVFEDVLTIPGTLAGLATYYGTLGGPVVPGTVTLRAETAAAVFQELADSAPGAPGIEQSGVGVLEPSAGAAVGYIDYRTGAFALRLDGATFFVGGTIGGIWVGGQTEAVGSTTRGLGAYSGGLSDGPVAPGFFNANKAVLVYSVEEQVGDVPLGASAADSTDPLLKGLAGYIVPGTVVLSPSTATTDPLPPAIYDDGLGGLRTAPLGGGVAVPGGTIDYITGAWATTTWDPVGGVAFPGVTAAQLQATYDVQIVNQGGNAVPGDVGTYQLAEPLDTSAAGGASADDTNGTAVRIAGPIFPGSLVLRIADVAGSPFVAYDNGLGGWLTHRRGDPRQAAVTGTIDYDTGEWSITPGAAITATTAIECDYTSAVRTQAQRALRGSTSQILGTAAEAAWGLAQTAPAAANSLRGSDFLNHETGAFGFTLNLQTTGTQTFDVADAAPITAVYTPATILGFGDGTETTFTGELGLPPYRRAAGRLRAFQSGQISLAGAGDPQVAQAALGASSADDFWLDNVVVATDPDNFLSFGSGLTSIQWTGAPVREEAVFVIAEDTVGHLTARYVGDIGNERPILADGLWFEVEQDPSTDPVTNPTLRLLVRFGATEIVESFGQRSTLQELADAVNDPVNGSDFVRIAVTSIGSTLTVDVDGTQAIGLTGAFTVGDIVGARVGQTYTGIQQFQNAELVPLNFVATPGQWHRQVIIALQTLASRRGRNAIGLVPLFNTTDPFAHRDFINGEFNSAGIGQPAVATAVVPFPPAAELNSKFLATPGQWVTYLDEYVAQEVEEPGEGECLRLIGNTDRVAKPWFPIAGFRRGNLTVSDIAYSPSRDDRDLLYGLVGNRTECLNVFINRVGRGLALFGQRTLQRNPSSTDRINVQWTINVIQNLIDFVSQEFLFELNDTTLYREMEATLNDILAPIVERRGLEDAHVEVSPSTTTPDDVNNLRVRGKLFITPARAVENIEYDLILTPSGADFSEVRI